MVSRLELSARCPRTPSRAANRTTDRNHINRDSPACSAHKPLAPSKHPPGSNPRPPMLPPSNPTSRRIDRKVKLSTHHLLRELGWGTLCGAISPGVAHPQTAHEVKRISQRAIESTSPLR
jgi:hypothetical protein